MIAVAHLERARSREPTTTTTTAAAVVDKSGVVLRVDRFLQGKTPTFNFVHEIEQQKCVSSRVG